MLTLSLFHHTYFYVAIGRSETNQAGGIALLFITHMLGKHRNLFLLAQFKSGPGCSKHR